MLTSRKRANSFELLAPQPSTTLNAIDSAELTICDFSDPRSLRGNLLTARRMPSTRSCDLRQTSKLRKFCMTADYRPVVFSHSPYFRKNAQISAATEEPLFNYSTVQLITQNLHQLSLLPNSPLIQVSAA